MKARELREMTLDELRSREAELAKECFNLRMQHATGQLENPLKLRMIRRDIARVKTVKAQKEREAQDVG
ncbi:MAG TPA: 50S ribosomal protein L29 [Deltaproteobacteria bacterium]|nr:50S ribosomal protein L29 [Deltaproteobacteria bacterium]